MKTKWEGCGHLNFQSPSWGTPPTRPQLLILPRKFHHLETNHSKIGAYGGQSHSNPHRTEVGFFLWHFLCYSCLLLFSLALKEINVITTLSYIIMIRYSSSSPLLLFISLFVLNSFLLSSVVEYISTLRKAIQHQKCKQTNKFCYWLSSLVFPASLLFLCISLCISFPQSTKLPACCEFRNNFCYSTKYVFQFPFLFHWKMNDLEVWVF